MTAAAANFPVEAGTQYRKAITAGVIGNVLEWYDFGVYGYLVPTISLLFFPSGDPVVSLLSTFAVFGVGFVMRPVGSILFGIYGDRHGRRKALSTVVFVMALATFGMGLLPTYGQVGVLAPALLVVVRLFQGLSAGGQWGGSTAYIVEFAPPARRGFFGSWQLVGVGGGFLLDSLTAALLNGALPQADRLAWGWRLPFLFGVVVGAVGFYLRWRLDDTPKFTEIEEQGAVAAAPLGEALRQYPRETLLGFGVTLHNTVAYYIALVYLTNYMSSVGKLAQSTALWIGTSCLAVFAGLAFGPRRKAASADRLLHRLRRAGLSVFLDGLVGQYWARGIGAAADGLALRALRGSMSGVLCRDLSDPGPLHRIVDRVQHRGCDLWRVRAVHRHLSRADNGQQSCTGRVCHHSRDRHPRNPAANARDRFRAAALASKNRPFLSPQEAHAEERCGEEGEARRLGDGSRGHRERVQKNVRAARGGVVGDEEE